MLAVARSLKSDLYHREQHLFNTKLTVHIRRQNLLVTIQEWRFDLLISGTDGNLLIILSFVHLLVVLL